MIVSEYNHPVGVGLLVKIDVIRDFYWKWNVVLPMYSRSVDDLIFMGLNHLLYLVHIGNVPL
jgi:hypothetical protein